MRKNPTTFALAFVLLTAVQPVRAHVAPHGAKPPTMAAKADRTADVGSSVPARHVKQGRHRHSARGPRMKRHHHSRWRHVWIYRAHDRHGHRHYEYVRRTFGGYFARRCDEGF